MSNEKKYYPEITQFLLEHVKSLVDAYGLDYLVLGGFDTLLAKGIKDICSKNELYNNSIRNYCEKLTNLTIDIFFVLLNPNNEKFKVFLVEVKDTNSTGLNEYSQLIGYCLSSKINNGILVNVDSGASRNLVDLLSLNKDMNSIRTIDLNQKINTYNFGVFTWLSKTKNLQTLNLGVIRNLSTMIVSSLDDLK